MGKTDRGNLRQFQKIRSLFIFVGQAAIIHRQKSLIFILNFLFSCDFLFSRIKLIAYKILINLWKDEKRKEFIPILRLVIFL